MTHSSPERRYSYGCGRPGCCGTPVAGHSDCLAHLESADRALYLASLHPGADIDHRGTALGRALVEELLGAVRDPESRRPVLGHARFEEAVFPDGAFFHEAEFSSEAHFRAARFLRFAGFRRTRFAGPADFTDACFEDESSFVQARFEGQTLFYGARFHGEAEFLSARFHDVAWMGGARFGTVQFDGAGFDGDADFSQVRFDGETSFTSAEFGGRATFSGARFECGVSFGWAHFAMTPVLGPLVSRQTLSLWNAVFDGPVVIEAAASGLDCGRTRWASTATLRLRHADLDLTDAVCEYPVTVAARATPFAAGPHPLPEDGLSGDPGVRLVSVNGVDAAHLMLHDIDLSACRFAGAVHLDQLRVDGWCTFAVPPTATRRPWSPRKVLAEEHHWRARAGRTPGRRRGWTKAPDGTPGLRPAAIAALYRQLRKSLEDGRNEPDAADFYYGEMEMRRHDTSRTMSERALVTSYWALSGYGSRAARALIWLLAAMTGTLLAMMLWGLPADDPKPLTKGRQVAVGQDMALVTETPDPVNPAGPVAGRLTTERFEKAVRVVINSVVFRSSGQELTTAGTYTEMASRITEPVLLGLAVLAVRNRVKR
ncbi:pentapeptide repeat-containing protein [Streptomyces atroolivaceus]|uniref:pentapeptide repeat-containing protein n=1 Tax=Streptomyces atroolivaceus TaxID=66869 RepID=UPI0020257C26|nr:pentapeptide repeat-containing protein [Streptomyces atroolivaceus]